MAIKKEASKRAKRKFQWRPDRWILRAFKFVLVEHGRVVEALILVTVFGVALWMMYRLLMAANPLPERIEAQQHVQSDALKRVEEWQQARARAYGTGLNLPARAYFTEGQPGR